jgi:ABC-2 type transport system ATP-binding protein
MAPPLELHGVEHRYGERMALAGVDLTVSPGQIVALLGPNGAGKTTLAAIAAGVLEPTRGTVRVCGDGGRRRGRRVGFAPQDVGVYPTLTVRENLRAFGELAGLEAGHARARARELLVPLQLDALADRTAAELSGGEQRRLHTAVALVAGAPLVLLDEPTAGADAATRTAILGVVRALAAAGAAVLYTTHYLPEVERLDAHVAVLERGRLIASAPLAELIAAHAQAALEVEFDDPGDRLVVAVDEPERELARLLGELDGTRRLRSVAILRPSLDAAYLSLTGRRDAEAG